MLALLGPNGAGKTTTVEALEGYRPVAARIGPGPRPRPRTRTTRALVPRIGVMLQRGGVYPMLGPAQVLHLFAAYYDDPEDPDALLDLVGLGDARRTPWRRLSGGEQQRLSLALALVGRPEVLFLDEPTAGVDPEGRLVVRDLIAAQRDRGLCVLLTTHELAEAERLADQVVIIDHGRMLAEGTPAELAVGHGRRLGPVLHRPGHRQRRRLAAAVGPGASVVGGASRRLPAPGPRGPRPRPWWPRWPAGWPTGDLALGDLRTGQSLEEAYLAITGARDGPEPEHDGRRPAGAGRRRRGRRSRGRR